MQLENTGMPNKPVDPCADSIKFAREDRYRKCEIWRRSHTNGLAEPPFNREGPAATYDWFKTYADISEIIHQIIPDRTSRILMLGCGNSTLSEEVQRTGSQVIVDLYWWHVDVWWWVWKHREHWCMLLYSWSIPGSHWKPVVFFSGHWEHETHTRGSSS